MSEISTNITQRLPISSKAKFQRRKRSFVARSIDIFTCNDTFYVLLFLFPKQIQYKPMVSHCLLSFEYISKGHTPGTHSEPDG